MNRIFHSREAEEEVGEDDSGPQEFFIHPSEIQISITANETLLHDEATMEIRHRHEVDSLPEKQMCGGRIVGQAGRLCSGWRY